MSFFDEIDDLSGSQPPKVEADEASVAEPTASDEPGRNLPAVPVKGYERAQQEVTQSDQPQAAEQVDAGADPFEQATPLAPSPLGEAEDAVVVEPGAMPVERLSSKYSDAPAKQTSKKRLVIYGAGLLLLGLLAAAALGGKKTGGHSNGAPTYAPATEVSPTAIYGTTGQTTTDGSASLPETTPPQVISTPAATTPVATVPTTQGTSQVVAERQQAIASMDKLAAAAAKAGKKLPSDLKALAAYLHKTTGLTVSATSSAVGVFNVSFISPTTIFATYQGRDDISVTRLITVSR